MPMSTGANSDDRPSGTTAKPIRARVWRACEVCRKRKVKCDGNDPCAYCISCGKDCSFKESNDNASTSRQHAVSLENRLAKVEDTLRNLLPMTQAFAAWAEAHPSSNPDDLPFSVPDMGFDAPVPKALPNSKVSQYKPSKLLQNMLYDRPQSEKDALSTPITPQECDEPLEKWADRFSHLAKDRFGNLRYVGGASSFMLVEALASLQEDNHYASENLGDDQHFVPFVTPHGQFRSLKSLPKPEDVTYPTTELADQLVHAYFTRIHHTFPVLQQKLFLDRYVETMQSLHAGNPSNDPVYLACLFAVFACGSLVLPSKASQSCPEFEGLEYYERAQVLLLHGASSYYIEHVQCLALLSLCSASWNSLAQSWLHAGHAIRRAQDLGLHRSCRRANLSPLEKELRRRVWWCAYSLDKSLSISLGRPSSTHDDDCTVEYPAEIDDSQLLSWNSSNDPLQTQQEGSYMTGFIALLDIYKIAGKISGAVQSSRLEDPESDSARQTLAFLDEELSTWINSLPDAIRFGTNTISNNRLLSLCMVAYFVYYASIINLHHPFVPDPPITQEHLRSLAACLSAARSCIRIGETAQEVIPTSHYLAFVVQYITLSAILLVRSVHYVNQSDLVDGILTDVEKAASILTRMEDSWSGARRCREIVEGLLAVVRTKLGSQALNSLTAEQPASSGTVRKRKCPTEEVSRERARPRLLGPQPAPCFDPSGMHGQIEPFPAESFYPSLDLSPPSPSGFGLFPENFLSFSSTGVSTMQPSSSSRGPDSLPDFLSPDFFALLGSAAQTSSLSNQDYQQNAEILSGVLSPFNTAADSLQGNLNILFGPDPTKP